MEIQQAFGERVRQLRKQAGLSQQELADRCGGAVRMQRIGEIERGERNCTLRTIQSLALGLGCDAADLFLFRPQSVGRRLSQLDARLADAWRGADDETKGKIIRVLAELLR